MIHLRIDDTTQRRLPFYLAMEEWAAKKLPPADYFFSWQVGPTVIFGRNQCIDKEVNLDYCRRNGIETYRRKSGGGCVFADSHNIMFSYITPSEHVTTTFARYTEMIAGMLRSLGLKAEASGRNDITIEGRKFSGNSQYIRNKRIMHHGTMMFDSDLSVVSACLNVSKDKIESKGVKSVRSRVTNIREYLREDITLYQFKELLLRFMQEETPMERHIFTPKELARAGEIQRERYGRWEWNYGYSPRYRLRKERYVEGCGKILVSMEVKDGCVENMEFYGDYFGNGDTAELAVLLKGCRMERESLLTALAPVDVERYFNHLQKGQLADLLLQ